MIDAGRQDRPSLLPVIRARGKQHVRILLWHVHGSWTNNFVSGPHEYYLPWLPSGGPYGLGRGTGESFEWPSGVHNVAPEQLPDLDFDVMILQRPEEVQLAERWTRRRPGVDVRAVYLEHNTPGGNVPYTAHPMAHQSAVPLVHVTYFNNLIWDSGQARTTVIRDGIVDPGHLYSGTLNRMAVAINDPLRRGRAVGTDLLPQFGEVAPIDVYGMNTDLLDYYGNPNLVSHNVPQPELHRQMAERRVYLHLYRWNAIGLSLMEAMMIGMPVLALNLGEIPHVLQGSTSLRASLSLDQLRDQARTLLNDPDLAMTKGRECRAAALEHFSLADFHNRWSTFLGELQAEHIGY